MKIVFMGTPDFAVPSLHALTEAGYVGEDVENILSEFRALLESLNFKGKVVLEMGRFLAAACGYYVTSIVDMKVNKEQPYVIMDGGINHLNYYGQAMAMKQPYCTQLDTEGNEKTGGEEESWNLCGALCTVSDVVVKRFPLHKPQLHDILVFERGIFSGFFFIIHTHIFRYRRNLFIPEPSSSENLFLDRGRGTAHGAGWCTYRSFKFREIKDHGNTEK